MANLTPLTIVVLDGNGAQQIVPVPPPYLTPVDVNANSGFPLQLVAATANMLTRVFRIFLVVDGPTTITFKDGGTVLPGAIKIEQPGEAVEFDPQLFPWYQGSVNSAFSLNSSANVQITGHVDVNLNPT